MKILIVDDEETIGRALKTGLEMNGFTVRYESCSTGVIAVCLEFHPDLVLLDIGMPVKDGGLVASELRNHQALRNTPVIFLSSLVNKEEAQQNTSGDILLSKPIPIAELVLKIRAVLHNKAV